MYWNRPENQVDPEWFHKLSEGNKRSNWAVGSVLIVWVESIG